MSLPSRADVVVVGAGPGGSAAACRLAQSGAEVLILERGVRPAALTQREDTMLPQLRLGGAETVISPGLMLSQGTGPGGGSVMSLAVSEPLPRAARRSWGEHGLDVAAFREAAAAIEAMLGVKRIPEEAVNRNNALLYRGARALSYRVRRLSDSREGCTGAGFCALGCAQAARLDASTVLLPEAQRSGAVLVEGAAVTRLLTQRGRITGVAGQHETRGPFTIEADAVVLAAGAVGSARLAAPLSDQAGEGLFFHPTAAVLALFPEAVEGWRGIPRSVVCDQFLSDGIWLSPSFHHPATLAGWLPGHTDARRHLMSRLRHLALCEVVVADEATGRLRRGKVRYRLSRQTKTRLARGITEAARLWLAAGAQRVVVPWSQPARLNSMADAELLRGRLPLPGDPPLHARWAGGGLAIGRACDGQGRLKGVSGLYVADASLMPEATATPPLLSIYALGWMVAGALTDR